MQQIFKISNLLKYRTQLMGFAMIWVISYHFGLGAFNLPFINFIGKTGYGGVDLFLFLSGLGIYFSLSKDENKKRFYTKRLLRIMPYYVPVVLIVMICKGESVGLILLNITTLSFWFNSSFQFDWYIPALIFLYLLTPFYYSLFKYKPLIVTVVLILISVLLSFNLVLYKIFTTRIPLFFIGFLLGYLIANNYQLKKTEIIITFLIGFIGIGWLYYNVFMLEPDYLWKTGMWWYPFILITFPLLLVISGIISLFNEYHFPILSFMGKYSLALYLLHWNILPALDTINYFEVNKIMARVVALILTFFLGYYYQNIIEKYIDKIIVK